MSRYFSSTGTQHGVLFVEVTEDDRCFYHHADKITDYPFPATRNHVERYLKGVAEGRRVELTEQDAFPNRVPQTTVDAW